MSGKNLPNYAIVSPVRNEQDYIRATLDSVVSQTILPLQWVIVDDGSTDQTAAIVSEYERIYPWIRLVHRKDHQSTEGLARGEEAKAFYEGFAHIDLDAMEFVGKLDGDLVLDPDYFEQLLNRAVDDARLGILSGVTYFRSKDRPVLESVPATYAGGAAKLWRVACFKDIGGLVTTLGWDVLDVIRAQMQGWKTRSYPELQILHLRPTASKDNWYKGRSRTGLTDYLLGYHPIFEIARCLYRMTHRPYLLGGLFMFLGYIRATLRQEEQIVNAEERDFLQKQQLSRLFKLKVR